MPAAAFVAVMVLVVICTTSVTRFVCGAVSAWIVTEPAGEKFFVPLRTSKPTGIGLVGWFELFGLSDAGRLVFAMPDWPEYFWLLITGGVGVPTVLTGELIGLFCGGIPPVPPPVPPLTPPLAGENTLAARKLGLTRSSATVSCDLTIAS